MKREPRWDGGNAWKDWRPMLRALLAEHAKPAATGDILEAVRMPRDGHSASVSRALRQLVDAGELRTWTLRGEDGGVRRMYQWTGAEMHGPVQRGRA